MSTRNLETRYANARCNEFVSRLSSRLMLGLLSGVIFVSSFGTAHANDKIKQAILKYESRMEEERAKVIAVFERESKLAARKQDKRHEQWLANARTSWMNKEMMISERGGLRFFTGTEEAFGLKDFNLSGDFELRDSALLGDTGNATVRMSKPASALYFRGFIESKNNFAIHLNQTNLAADKDIAIIVGGWGNSRSEIHFDGETIASKPVGMPPRWLCEVYYQGQGVTIYANGAELLSARLPQPRAVSHASLSVSYDSKTAIYQPVLKVK